MNDIVFEKKHVELQGAIKVDDPAYQPGALLDAVIHTYGLRNDARLSRALKVPPPIISKYRSKRLPISDTFVLRVHDATGWPIEQIRELMGARKRIDRIAVQHRIA